MDGTITLYDVSMVFFATHKTLAMLKSCDFD